MRPWGTSTAALVAGAAARYPDRVAVHDDAGSITYRELWHRAQALATGLVSEGVSSGTRVGLLGRNHRGFVKALTAVAATGADLVLLNTGFAGPQLADVVDHEGIDVIIHDDEFAGIVGGCGARPIDESTQAAMASAPTSAITPADRAGTVVNLTSGTT
jgi:fatty-acyl-CoA synthase